ncbi:hypothetical protein ACFYY8_17625 [Streptosporangium sp. NPDC001559]|uniref:hypothetical protein n=1 Tax=Streptosporangium sp. NPDC001559 TaxID=3366187 RepID=UPI0036F10451
MSDSRFAPTEPTTLIPAAATARPGSAKARGARALAHSTASSALGLAQPTPCADRDAACRTQPRAPSWAAAICSGGRP